VYKLGHIGNVDQTPAYFNIMLNVNVEEHDVKTVLIRGMGNEKTKNCHNTVLV
jgi:hypothetical protein